MKKARENERKTLSEKAVGLKNELEYYEEYEKFEKGKYKKIKKSLKKANDESEKLKATFNDDKKKAEDEKINFLN